MAKESAAAPPLPDRSAHLVVLSASSETALRDLSLAYAKHLAKEGAPSLADVCHTAAVGRSALPHRLAFPAPNITLASELLDSFAQGKSKSAIVSGRVRSDSRVAFLFTGQGAQQRGMGRDLYRTEPVFRDAFDKCALLLVEQLDRPLQEVIGYDTNDSAPAGLLDETAYTQPALFAFEYALTSLWRSWGIEPAAIVGHSLGEYVGACVAGVLSLEDALRLVATRSRLMQSLQRNGAMAAVFAGEDRVRTAIAPYTDSVSIAAINSPLNTVISGKAEDVRAVLERLIQEHVEARPLTVSHAFHSPLVEPILDEFEQCARSVVHHAPVVDLVLNVTGCPLSETLPLDASYWRRHARTTVRFAESIRALHARGIRAFLEIGPGPTLIRMGRQCVEDSETTWLTSLSKDLDTGSQMLSSLGALFVLGAKPDWGAFDRPYRRSRVALPTYPFQRQRHWLPVARKWAQKAGHPLLGMHVPLAGHPGEHIWSGEISLERCPWIADHRVQGVAVMPATAYVEMAIAAAVEAVSELPMVLTQIEMEKVLTLQPTIEFEIQTRLEQKDAGVTVFQVHSRKKDTKGDWTLHASGALRAGGIAMPVETFDASQRHAFEKRFTRCLDGLEFYQLHKKRGNEWGPCFQGVSRAWPGRGEALSEVTVPLGIQGELSRYFFHPAFSDSLGHVLTATIPLESSDGRLGGAFVGAGIEELRVYRRPEGTHFYAYAKLRSNEAAPGNTLVGDVKVFDFAGNLITEIIGARLWNLDSGQKHDVIESIEDWLYEPQWMSRKEPTNRALKSQLREHGLFSGIDKGSAMPFVCNFGRGDMPLRGSRWESETKAVMTIRPDNVDDYDGLLCAAARPGSVVKGSCIFGVLTPQIPKRRILKTCRKPRRSDRSASCVWFKRSIARSNQRLPSCG